MDTPDLSKLFAAILDFERMTWVPGEPIPDSTQPASLDALVDRGILATTRALALVAFGQLPAEQHKRSQEAAFRMLMEAGIAFGNKVEISFLPMPSEGCEPWSTN